MGRYLLAAAVAVVLFDQDFLAVAELGVQLFGHWRREHGHSTRLLVGSLLAGFRLLSSFLLHRR